MMVDEQTRLKARARKYLAGASIDGYLAALCQSARNYL
jgi:hypothetical protein